MYRIADFFATGYSEGMSISICSLGAAEEVTGSKHLLEVDSTRILIDCGAFQGKRAKADNKNRALLGDDIEASSIDALVLTHAHYDHCGLVPYLAKKGFTGNIYATSATRDLANLIMSDSAHIQARDADYLSRQAEKRHEKFDWKPLYDDFDVIRAMDQFVTVSYHRPISIADGIQVEFLDAGHILGSTFARITAKDKAGNVAILGFSGDLGRKGKPIIKDPECLDKIDFLILDSTYGNRLHESTMDALRHLEDVVNRTAERRGKLIIPAFAVERTQELIFCLHLLHDQGRIPNIPIWVDSPMALNATSIFAIHPECYDKETYDLFTTHAKNPFGFSALNFSRSVEDSKALNQAKGPLIIISADGMCEFGRIQHHLMHGLGDSANTVLIVGYMAEGTLGRRLRDGAKEVRIQSDWFQVRANIEEIDAFSAHADWKETVEWLDCIEKERLKGTFLVHGEPEALMAMQGHLQDAGLKDIEIAKMGVIYKIA